MTQQQQNLDRFRIGIFDKSLNIIIKPDTKFDVIDSEDKNGKTQYHLVIYEGFSIDENGNYIKDKDGNRIKKELLRKLIDPKYKDCYSYDEWFSSKMEFCFGDFYWIEKYPENFTLLQSTGLKDKNGRLICEGDIVKFIDYSCTPHKEVVREVRYVNTADYGFNTFLEPFSQTVCGDKLANGRWQLTVFTTPPSESEIIGNIHTHPELLTSIEKGEEIHL